MGFRNPWDATQPSDLPPGIAGPVSPWVRQPLGFSGLPQPTASAVDPSSGFRNNQGVSSTQESHENMLAHQMQTPEQQRAAEASIMSSPFIQQQLRSQEANKRLFEMQLMQRRPVDLAHGLSAMADAFNAGTAPQYRTQPIAPDQGLGLDAKQIREYAKQQQDDERDITRQAYQAIRGYNQDTLNSQLMTKLGLTAGASAGNPVPSDQNDIMERQDAQRAFRAHQMTVQAIKRDPVMNKQIPMYLQLGNALSVLQNVDKLTPQQIQEAQQNVRQGLNLTGKSGVQERERDYINTLGLNVDSIEQFLSGDLANVPKNSPIVEHVKQLAQIEQENVKNQVDDRLAVASGGNDWVYHDPRYPQYRSSLQSLLGAVRHQVARPGPTGGTHEAAGVRVNIGDMMKELMDERAKKAAGH